MIGNDIVDLNAAKINSRWQEQRFLDKLFTQKEQSYILRDNFRFQNIWRLWSMKESAYKIYSRNIKELVFIPKKFSCDVTSETCGTVTYDNHIVNTKTSEDINVVYTVAQLQETFKIAEYFKFKKLSQSDTSEQLKQKAILAFATPQRISESDISIVKNTFGVPQFVLFGKVQDAFLTLTHHGNYGGFAISF